jgi:NAD(P)-dependent dehydrogenase (short-subunit alcohol dehydrogenase family)
MCLLDYKGITLVDQILVTIPIPLANCFCNPDHTVHLSSKISRHVDLHNHWYEHTATLAHQFTHQSLGANRGLGLEFVRQLSLDESNTILACVRSSSSDLADLKKAASSSTQILTCDTGDIESIRSFATEASKALDGSKVDYLLNNAGINSVPEQTSLSINPADLEENIRVNVIGPAKMTQFLLEADLLSSSARIMNMSSGLGSMAVSLSIEPRKCATYSISKAALNALTVQQSGEVAQKLGTAVVICMDPGWVKTRMGGSGAVLEAEESIGGMLKCLHGLSNKSNGKFFTYTGEEVAW